MNTQFAIYIPSTNNINESIDNSQYVKRVAKLLVIRFGGASWEQISGAWYSNTLESLVIEGVTRIWAYSETNTAQDRAYVKVIANAVKTWMSQEAVAFEVIEHKPESGLLFA